MQTKLTPFDNALTADQSDDSPQDGAITAAAACAAVAALDRGWVPNPSDPHGLDTERAKQWVDIIIGVAAYPAPSVIALGHSAVAWLNTNHHVTSGFTAVLDERGFRIVRSAAKQTDMFKLHQRLLTLASRHGVELNRLHA